MLSLHELPCYPRVSAPSKRHGPLTSLSWWAGQTCISWEARGTWGSLLTRGSRGARPPRLSRRPLDGPHWWRVAGNLVKDGRVPGHVTWDGKDKDSVRWTVTRAMEGLGALLVKAPNNSVRHPPRHAARPSEISWFPNERSCISLWMILAAGLCSNSISCIWNSTAHVSISVSITEQKS